VTPDRRAPRVVVLADDLIWATRLVDGVRRARAEASSVRTMDSFTAAIGDADGAVVDLTARAYDGILALAGAREKGVPTIAVGQHDDHAMRRSALAAGATKVYPYRALFEHGDRALARWVATLESGSPVDHEEGER
jgi:hypothetical protein